MGLAARMRLHSGPVMRRAHAERPPIALSDAVSGRQPRPCRPGSMACMRRGACKTVPEAE